MIYIKILAKTILYFIFSCFYKREYITICDGFYNDFNNIFEIFKQKKVNFLELKKSNNIYDVIHNLKIMAKSKVIITNISHNDLSQVLIRRGLIIVYSCHGGGCYKKMGYAAFAIKNCFIEKFRLWRVHGRYSYIISTSSVLHDYISNNYNIKKECVIALGSPRTDCLFMKQHNRYLKTKKTILYAPTFRTNDGKRVLPAFISVMVESLCAINVTVLFRAHPTIKQYTVPPGWTDVTHDDYFQVLEASDILITDYSSILFDFSYYARPIFLFVPDEKEYRRQERDLWISPSELVGTNVCRSMEDLCRCLQEKCEQPNHIWQNFMDACDGHSSERVADFLLSLGEGDQGDTL